MGKQLLFNPVLRVFWHGPWRHERREHRRRLYDTELVYCKSGEFRLSLNGTLHLMKPGSLALIPPNYWHESWLEAGKSTHRYCQHFDWDNRRSPRQQPPLAAFEGETLERAWLQSVPAEIARRMPRVMHEDESSPMLEVVETFFQARVDRLPIAPLLLWPIVAFMLSKPESRPRGAGSPEPPGVVLKVREIIESRFAEPLGYDDFINATGWSRAHLCQTFSRFIGRPPTAYLIDVRLREARKLIQMGIPTADAARAVGVQDVSYFCRLFRKRFGHTSGDLRRR